MGNYNNNNQRVEELKFEEIDKTIKLSAYEVKKLRQTTDFSKIQHQLTLHQEEIRRSEKKLVFLLLSGSFNPVHIKHFEMLEIAKARLEEKFGNEVIIIGGFLATSSDFHVGSKVGKDFAIKLEHRNKLLKIVTGSSDWISYCGLGNASSYATTQLIRILLNTQLRYYLGDDVDLSFYGMELCGSDLVIRCPRIMEFPMICVERGNEKENRNIVNLINSNAVSKHFIWIPRSFDHRLFHDVSSTKIRNSLPSLFNPNNNNSNNMVIESECIEYDDDDDDIDGDIDPEVIKYMKDHCNSLFLSSSED